MKSFILIFTISLTISFSLKSQSRLWGTTFTSNVTDTSYYYSLDDNGQNMQIEFKHSTHSKGWAPCAMVVDSGHVLYGLNNYGGTYAKGSIYKYNISTDSITYLASFSGANGAYPVLKMTKANNGSFYGLIDYCGDSLKGLLYEFNPTNNTITKKVDFYGTANGKHPSHPLLLASNGKLYGTTKTGGQYNAGVLFEFNPNTGILTKLVDFSSAKGINPIGNISESGGKIYGVCRSGPSIYRGFIFEYDFNQNIYSKKYSFGITPGSLGVPLSGLSIMGADTLIGWSRINNNSFFYAIYKFHPSTNSISYNSMLYSTNMSTEFMQVTQSSDDYLYYSSNDYGYYQDKVLRYSRKEDTLKIFHISTPYNQATTCGSAIEYNGDLYVTNTSDGKSRRGCITKIDTSTSTNSIIYNFNLYGGTNPSGYLTYASNSNIYTIYSEDGKYRHGSILKFNPITHQSIEFPFTDSIGIPYGKLLEKQGKLYGIVYNHHKSGSSIFSIDLQTDSIEIVKFYTDSLNPRSDGIITLDAAGNIWGTYKIDYRGIFEYNFQNDTFIIHKAFGINDIMDPIGGLVESANNIFYGVSRHGGTQNKGYVYKYNNNTKTFVNIHSFGKIGDASEPMGIIKTSNNEIYGTSFESVTSGRPALLFRIHPSNDSISIMNTLQRYSSGILCESTNGKLYLPSRAGGLWSHGYVSEINLTNNTINTCHDFNSPNYFYPLEVLNLLAAPTSINDTDIEKKTIIVFPNPFYNKITINAKSTIEQIEIYNSTGKLLNLYSTKTKSYSIDLQNIPSGIYILRINTQSKIETHKIIKY